MKAPTVATCAALVGYVKDMSAQLVQFISCVKVNTCYRLVGDASCLQQPRRGHPRFPESRGGFVHGPPPSSNLIVIQTMPMEGDSKPARHRLPTAHLTGPRSQVPPLSNAPTALLRPQDKWEARETAKPKRT